MSDIESMEDSFSDNDLEEDQPSTNERNESRIKYLKQINDIKYRPTFTNLKRNISLISTNPNIRELVEPFTVPSLISELPALLERLEKGPNDKDIDSKMDILELIEEYRYNSSYLSELLLILTLNLIVSENQFKSLTFRSFDMVKEFGTVLEFAKEGLSKEHLRDFNYLCLVGCSRIFFHISYNSTRLSNSDDKNSDGGNFMNNGKGDIIYYNISLSSLHLCIHYHGLNIDNWKKLNKPDPGYKHSKDEAQKALYFNKSVDNFQLISHNNESLKPKVLELFKQLFTFERYFLLFSSVLYRFSNFRHHGNITHLELNGSDYTSNLNPTATDNVSQKLFQLFLMFERIDNFYEDGTKRPFQCFTLVCNEIRLIDSDDDYDDDLSFYKECFLKFQNITSGPTNSKLMVFDIVKNLLLFRILMSLYRIDEEDIVEEEYIRLNAHLLRYIKSSPSGNTKLMFVNFQIYTYLERFYDASSLFSDSNEFHLLFDALYEYFHAGDFIQLAHSKFKDRYDKLKHKTQISSQEE
ncbi:hypothetical protein DFJ63DRAFT_35630 [Scheffersomyces coipomensis]|uniref:uncharacterized protein n=1 Tax=Scheffersomyces coipomensis TaxID=1788519 RepID=UPI00315DB93A